MSDKKEEPLYLNGASQQFLMEWGAFQETFKYHLKQSAKDHEELENVRQTVGIHGNIFKIIAGTLVVMVPTIIGIWAKLAGWF